MYIPKKIILFIQILTFTILLSISHSSQLIAKDLVIESISTDLKLQSLPEEKVISILPLKKSDVFNDQKLQNAIEELEKTRLFSIIKINQKIKNGKVYLHYQLTENLIIRKVNISGHYPFLEKTILRQSSLQPGEIFQEENIQSSIERITKYLEKYGYYNSKINVETQRDYNHPMVNIDIFVVKGETYKLGQFNADGNTVFTDSYLKNFVYNSFARFKPVVVKKKLKNLREKYIKKGFVRARVKEEKTEINPLTDRIDLDISIKERKKVNLEFIGNSWFRYSTLRNHTTFYDERSYGKFAVERSLKKLKNLYTVNGFLSTKIEVQTEENEQTKNITFHIEEGIRTRLKEIKFIGNNEVKSKILKEVMDNKEHTIVTQGLLNLNYLSTDLEKIKTKYQELGFLDIEIIKQDITLNQYRDQAILEIVVNEGDQYTLGKTTIIGNKNVSDNTIQDFLKIKKDKPISIKKLTNSLEKIANHYFEKGYAYFDIKLDKDIDKKNKKINLKLMLTEGPLTKIGTIIIQGTYHTEKKTILKNMKVNSGDLYQKDKVLDAQLNLKKLAIFDHVYITSIGIEQQNPIVDLIVKVHESKRHTLDLQAGFDSDKLGSAQVLFTKRNLFGLAKQFQTRVQGGFELSRAEMTLFHPKIFYASWNLYNQVFIQYEDDENFNAYSYGTESGVAKPFGPYTTLILKSGINHFNIIEDESNQDALDKNIFDSTFFENEVGVVFDSRDNFSDPSKGIYTTFTSQFNTDLSDLSNNFNVTHANLSIFYKILPRTTLIQTFRAGKIFKFNSDADIPVNKLFFQGGNDTIRGFDEDGIDDNGGTTSLISNTELHFRLVGNLKLAGFLDMGSLTDSFNEINRNTIRESAGFGIRYFTPIGPIRLDYGFVLDKRENEEGQRFHFSFGYFF